MKLSVYLLPAEVSLLNTALEKLNLPLTEALTYVHRLISGSLASRLRQPRPSEREACSSLCVRVLTECKETLTQEPFPQRSVHCFTYCCFSVMHIVRERERDFNIKHTRYCKFRLTVILFCLFRRCSHSQKVFF